MCSKDDLLRLIKFEKVTLGNLSATEVARDRTDEIQAGNLYRIEIC